MADTAPPMHRMPPIAVPVPRGRSVGGRHSYMSDTAKREPAHESYRLSLGRGVRFITDQGEGLETVNPFMVASPGARRSIVFHGCELRSDIKIDGRKAVTAYVQERSPDQSPWPNQPWLPRQRRPQHCPISQRAEPGRRALGLVARVAWSKSMTVLRVGAFALASGTLAATLMSGSVDAGESECKKKINGAPYMPPDYFTCEEVSNLPPDPFGERPDEFGKTAWQWGWSFGHGMPLNSCPASVSTERGKPEGEWEQRWGIGCLTGRIQAGRNDWQALHPGWLLPDLDP